MLQHFLGTGANRSPTLTRRVAGLYAFLLLATACSWLWALSSFRHFPLLLGTAFIAYSLGLRHAVDADHIAAIDNITRKLMQDGKRPITTGFFFSLGHSSVVLLATILVAVTASAFKDRLSAFNAWGHIIGTTVSASVLLVLAALNIVVLIGLYRAFRRVARGGYVAEAEIASLIAGGGLLSRLLRSAFRLVTQSWHMFPLGFLFGLGFDTATEIGLLGISAAEASRGLPIWSILVFPALFTAGMALVDTTDSILMVGAYGWAFVKPVRKLFYNMIITVVSIVAALVVGGIEALGLVGQEFSLDGRLWSLIANLNEHFGAIGYIIIGVFAVSWIVSLLIYRAKGYDTLEMHAAE